MKTIALFALFASSVLAGIGLQSTARDSAPSSRDRIRRAVQKICPVSGETMAADAAFHKTVDAKTKESFYVCCEKCIDGAMKPEHLATIQKNQSAAQGHCLVMDNEVGADSKSQVIGGYRVFVCCPPCFKKIEKSSEKYLAKLDAIQEAYLDKKK